MKRTYHLIYIIVLYVFVSSTSAIAKEYPILHRGVRPLGMGGAFTAVADDENALFYNPAGLSRISTFEIGIINPLIDVSKDSINLVGDAQDIDMNDTGEVTNLLKDYIGKNQHLRLSSFPHLGFNVADIGVMIGGLGQGTVDVAIRNPVWPEVHTKILLDYGVLAGGGIGLPYTGLTAGAALKFIGRRDLNEVYTAEDIASDFEDILDADTKLGSGVSLDIGVMYELPFVTAVDTIVAVAVQNIPEMKMGDATDIKTQFNGGISVERAFAGFSILGAFDYSDITSTVGEDDDIAKRLHLGAEVKLPAVLSVRAGINQGYTTAGATIDLWVFKFDFATYAEEVGAAAGQLKDRRYVGQISVGW